MTNEAHLFTLFFGLIDQVMPRAFICENVKALASLARWESVRDALITKASRNYSTALLVLNSHDYGVPQNRERMFLVGFNRDEIDSSQSILKDRLAVALRGQRRKAPLLRDIVLSLGRAGSSTNRRVCPAKITFAKAPVLRRSPYAGMLFNGAGRPLPPDGRSSTLPATMGGNKTPIVDEAVIFDGRSSFVEEYHRRLWRGETPYSGNVPSQLRRLTVDECVAIQTFPANYDFAGSQSAIYRQIGNAVPCKLAEAVAKSAITVLEDKKFTAVRELMAAE
jgi:DNA (cytosine-5)-methyltransferase 1